MKSSIFIGSSSESQPIAVRIKEYFKNEFDCTVWTDHFFELNQSTYQTLCLKAPCFDYAIFIGGKDDAVLRFSKKSIKTAPRDNVYLEFGLYAGILSPPRTFFLIHKDCSVASDLSGITLLPFASKKDVTYCCSQIYQKIHEEETLNRINLLPSTSLALGYYENFLVKVAPILFDMETLQAGGQTYHVKNSRKALEVIIPDNIDNLESWAEMYYTRKHVQKVDLSAKMRNIGVLLDQEALIRKNIVRLIDVPQPLRIASQSVEMALGKDFIGSTDLLEKAKRKEIRNFIRTLENKIRENSYCREFVKIRTKG